MIVAIQQPEHLPWIGFFNKMAQCELYVYIDNVQFKKRYFENRNKIKTKNGVKWITVPVNNKGKYSQKINEVLIDNNNNPRWLKKYLGTIEHAYKKSSSWNDLKNIIFPCFMKNTCRLVDLNLALIEQCKNYLKIETPAILASELGVDQFSGSDLILEICVKTNSRFYISGPDGRTYLKLDEFKTRGIEVLYHDFIHPDYPQMWGDFISHLSIIDLIANCGRESSNIVKDCYKIDFKNEK